MHKLSINHLFEVECITVYLGLYVFEIFDSIGLLLRTEAIGLKIQYKFIQRISQYSKHQIKTTCLCVLFRTVQS